MAVILCVVGGVILLTSYSAWINVNVNFIGVVKLYVKIARELWNVTPVKDQIQPHLLG